jgi:hypothetical protein
VQSLTATESEEKLMTKTYSIVSNDYINTGGHCMVNITTVYDYQHKTLLYVNINEESIVVTTHDFIQSDLPGEIVIEDITLHDISQEHFTTEPSFDNNYMDEMTDDMVLLILDCLEAFIKNKVKDEGRNYFTTYDKLPTVLAQQVTDDYRTWLDTHSQLIETDGYKIIVDERYTKELKADTPNEKAAKELQQHLAESIKRMDISDEECEEFYREKLQIIYCGKLFTFDNGADVYNALDEFASFVISEQ